MISQSFIVGSILGSCCSPPKSGGGMEALFGCWSREPNHHTLYIVSIPSQRFQRAIRCDAIGKPSPLTCRSPSNAKLKPQKPSAPVRNNPPQRAELVATQSETVRISSGPIPSPETLAEYDRVYPGLGQRIVAAFEAEYQKRHYLEKLALEADIEAMRLSHAEVRRGQWLGFVISMFGLVSAAVLVFLDHDAAGAALGGMSLAALVTAYLKSSRSPGSQPKGD